MTWRDDAVKALKDAQAAWRTSDDPRSYEAAGVDAVIAVVLREMMARPLGWVATALRESAHDIVQARKDDKQWRTRAKPKYRSIGRASRSRN